MIDLPQVKMVSFQVRRRRPFRLPPDPSRLLAIDEMSQIQNKEETMSHRSRIFALLRKRTYISELTRPRNRGLTKEQKFVAPGPGIRITPVVHNPKNKRLVEAEFRGPNGAVASSSN